MSTLNPYFYAHNADMAAAHVELAAAAHVNRAAAWRLRIRTLHIPAPVVR